MAQWSLLVDVISGDGTVDFSGMLYGAVAWRCWTREDDFGAFGAKTAHGRTPTKRSPTGLASGDA